MESPHIVLSFFSLFRRRVVFLLGILVCFDASSQGFYSSSGPDIPIPVDNKVYYFGPIDESKFLYGVTKREGGHLQDFINGPVSYSQTIYSYKIDTHTSTKLIKLDFTESDFSPELVRIPDFIRFVVGEKKSYIFASGRLLVTDGTPDGTKQLGAFGTRYCCQIGSQMSRIYPLRLDGGDLYFRYQDAIDASDPYFQYVDSIAIWKTDGTAAGTKKVTQSFTDLESITYASNIFVNRYVDSSHAFYFAKGGLWKTGTDRFRPFIELDDDRVDSFSSGAVATIQTGNFFCGLNYNKTSKALWRFSNSGKLALIADGCDLVWSVGDRLFFSTGNELWETDGTSLGEQLLFRHKEKSDITSCKIDESIYFVLNNYRSNEKQFFQVNQLGRVLDRSEELLNTQELSTVSCLDRYILLESSSSKGFSHSPILFNPENRKGARVLNLGKGDRWSGPREDSTLLYRYTSRPIFLSMTAPPGLPSTLIMLLDED